MEYISSKIREHWCNKDFPACRTNDQIKRINIGFAVQGVCKVCGQTAWFRTRSINSVKSCGCVNSSGTFLTEETLIARGKKRLIGKVVANYEVIDVLKRVNKVFLLLCRHTETGNLREMSYSTWHSRQYYASHGSEYSEQKAKERRNQIEEKYAKKRWDLEKIWPDVVKAGRLA